MISGAGALTQSGVGTTNLTASNTYTGATTVNAGTLRLSKRWDGRSVSTPPSPLNTTTPGGTLGATAISVNTGGTLLLNAANAIGTTSSVTLNGGTFPRCRRG